MRPRLCSLRHVWTTIPEVGSSINTMEGLATCRQPRTLLDSTSWRQEKLHHAAATACMSVQQFGLSELSLQRHTCSSGDKVQQLARSCHIMHIHCCLKLGIRHPQDLQCHLLQQQGQNVPLSHGTSPGCPTHSGRAGLQHLRLAQTGLTSSTAMVRRFRCSTLSPLCPGLPTRAPDRVCSSTSPITYEG